MRIRINTDRRKIRLILPNALVFSRFSASMAAKGYAGEYPLTREQSAELMKILRRFAKKHKGFEFVEANSGDGTYVKIIL